jgi:hypothetical protein
MIRLLSARGCKQVSESLAFSYVINTKTPRHEDTKERRHKRRRGERIEECGRSPFPFLSSLLLAP